MKNKVLIRKKRHQKIRNKMTNTANYPRLSVFRSNKHINAQVIDDAKSMTIVSASDLKTGGKQSKQEKAREVGLLIAKKAQEKKVKKVVFDRGSYKYHGRVKSLAEGAREGGLVF